VRDERGRALLGQGVHGGTTAACREEVQYEAVTTRTRRGWPRGLSNLWAAVAMVGDRVPV
jgi:hypothetical protein